MIAFDHVTMFAPDRRDVSERLRAAGLHAVSGGEHVGFGSANDLCYFDLFYLEILEILDPVAAVSSGSEVCRYAVEFLRDGPGLATLAFETTNLDRVMTGLVARGIEPGVPVSMERRHADGFVSRSRIVYPTAAEAPVRLPIVIEREAGPDRRADLLREEKIIADHPAGVLTADHVGVAVVDLAEAAEFVGAAYGIAVGEPFVDATVGGRGIQLGTARASLWLYEPLGTGLVADRLACRGPGPFVLGVRADDPAALAARLGGNAADGLIREVATGFAWRIA